MITNLPMATKICQQTYLHLPIKIYKPTIIYILNFKYQYVIATDLGASIGIVT